MRSPRATLICTLITLGLAGCGDKTTGTASDTATGTSSGDTTASVPTTTDADTSASSTSTATPTTSTTIPTTDITATSDDPATTSGTTGEDTTGECIDLPPQETTTESSSTTNGGGPCQDPPDQPQDAACSDLSGCGCASGKCFLVPILGGLCSECLDDDDCPGGCTAPNPIAGVGATCNLGEPGAGCNSDATCRNTCAATCGLVLSVQGIIDVSTCGQCETNADCLSAKRPNCSPDYDVAGFGGQLSCKPDHSIPNNVGCSLTDDGMGEPLGNHACQSGKCGEASVMGQLKLGICGECNANADCPNGQVCSDPMVDLNGGTLIGSVCV